MLLGCSEQDGAAQSASSTGSGGGSACREGLHATADGGCVSPGVPADACGPGFAPDAEGGCLPALPDEDCGAGQMAVPGETSCRAVAPCGSSDYDGVPTDSATEHVDASYRGLDSDGSVERPWPTVQQGVDAAAPGAIVAIAAGTYPEAVSILDKPVRLWGRCPSMVRLEPPEPVEAAVSVRTAPGTEVRRVGLTGDGRGVHVLGSSDVVIEEVWVHDTTLMGIHLQNTVLPTTFQLRGSLIEGARMWGVAAHGTSGVIEATVVRDIELTTPDLFVGGGIDVFGTPEAAADLHVTIRSALVERNVLHGVYVLGARATLDGSVVRTTRPNSEGRSGRGVSVSYHDLTQREAALEISASIIDDNVGFGVRVVGAELSMRTTLIRVTAPNPGDRWGDAVGIVHAWRPARANIDSSRLTGSTRAGIGNFGATVTVRATLLDCNPIALDGEPIGYASDTVKEERAFVFDDLGGNLCGCGAEPAACVVSSAQLEPPEALDGQ